MLNYKGIYHDKSDDEQYYEFGALFKYSELVKSLQKLQRNLPRERVILTNNTPNSYTNTDNECKNPQFSLRENIRNKEEIKGKNVLIRSIERSKFNITEDKLKNPQYLSLHNKRTDKYRIKLSSLNKGIFNESINKKDLLKLTV